MTDDLKNLDNQALEQYLEMRQGQRDALWDSIKNGHNSQETNQFHSARLTYLDGEIGSIKQTLYHHELSPERDQEKEKKATQFAMEVANDREEDLTREQVENRHNHWMNFEFEKQEDVNRYVAFVLDNQDKFTDDEKREAAAKMQEAEDKGFDIGDGGRAWKTKEMETQEQEIQEQQIEGLASLDFGDMDFGSGMSPTDLPINNGTGQGRGTPS